MSNLASGALVHDFFLDYLGPQKGLRQSSIRSYRDTIRLFLPFVANDARHSISRLQLEDLPASSVLRVPAAHGAGPAQQLVPTRNQRLAALRTFFEYLARRSPEALRICQPGRRHSHQAYTAARHAIRASRSTRCSIGCLPSVASRCATASCCASSTIPALASRRSPTYASGISCSNGRSTSGCTVKAANGGSCHYGRTRRRN